MLDDKMQSQSGRELSPDSTPLTPLYSPNRAFTLSLGSNQVRAALFDKTYQPVSSTCSSG